MKKVIVPNEIVNNVAEMEIIKVHEARAKKEIKKQRTVEMITQGVDKEVAEAMTLAFMACGL